MLKAKKQVFFPYAENSQSDSHKIAYKQSSFPTYVEEK